MLGANPPPASEKKADLPCHDLASFSPDRAELAAFLGSICFPHPCSHPLSGAGPGCLGQPKLAPSPHPGSQRVQGLGSELVWSYWGEFGEYRWTGYSPSTYVLLW